MTDPRHTNPPPNPQRPSGGPMWAWIAGIAVVVLIAFALAAGWNNDPETAGTPPPATVGSGGTTMPPATADRNATGSSTTGSGAATSGTTGSGATGGDAGSTGAPAATPNQPENAPAATPNQPDNAAPNAGGQ